MTRHRKTLKSFDELDAATKEKFFDQPEPKPLKLVEPKHKQPGKLIVKPDRPSFFWRFVGK